MKKEVKPIHEYEDRGKVYELKQAKDLLALAKGSTPPHLRHKFAGEIRGGQAGYDWIWMVRG